MDENLPNNKTTGQPDNLDVIPKETHPTKTTRVINKFIALALVVIAVVFGVLLWWSFQKTDVLTVKNSPFPARIIQNGDGSTSVVVLTADYCKSIKAKGVIRSSYVSSSREVFLPVAEENLPQGCATQEFPFVIPKEIVPDTYKIKFRAIYNINPLKQGVVVEFESTEFEIKKP